MKTHITEYASKDWVLEQQSLIFDRQYFSRLIFQDINTNNYYQVYIKDGQITTHQIDCLGIVIDTPPLQTSYFEGDLFNPEGMIVKRINLDESLTEITNYTHDEYVVTPFIISYTDNAGITHTATLELNIQEWTPEAALQDFDYTDNGDGTYTLTDWNETNQGQKSTVVNVPDETYVVL